MTIRNRIKELRYVQAKTLIPNPRNWRTHPKGQRDALEAMLQEIGYADALIARETPDGLELLDGHLRASTTPDEDVPVLILDLDDEEAKKLLTTLDPISAMAGRDDERLGSLMQELRFSSQAVTDMLASLRGEQPDRFDAMSEWANMPEFTQPDATAWKSIPVHFTCLEDLQKFSELIGQPITEETRSIWFPPADLQPRKTRRYVVDGS